MPVLCPPSPPSPQQRKSDGTKHQDTKEKQRKQRKRTQKPFLHIEGRLKQSSSIRHDTVASVLSSFIRDSYSCLIVGSTVCEWSQVSLLATHLDQVRVGECSLTSVQESSVVRLQHVHLRVHIYQPVDTDDELFNANDDDDNQDSSVLAASVTELPNVRNEGVWDTLIYQDAIKEQLLNYIYTTVLFSEAAVDSNLISWNRLVLLHGPPGTGKTSLCRALAQKLSIRLSHRYTHGKLVEINSHSLFSKWFSESGKLVQRLFSRVNELVQDEQAFVVILIDEVESLTAARMGAASGNEPSDALRVVNALLTQLDKLKTLPNTLVLTTSNLSESIDPAFVDRADIKHYIGLPASQAIYSILQSCLEELCNKGIISPCNLLDWTELQPLVDQGKPSDELDNIERASISLFELAQLCEGMSGRRLRRLPVLAHSRYLGSGEYDDSDDEVEEKEEKSSGEEKEKQQNGTVVINSTDIRSGTAALDISDDDDDDEVAIGNMTSNSMKRNDNHTDEMLSWIEAMKNVVHEETTQHDLVKKGGSLTPNRANNNK